MLLFLASVALAATCTESTRVETVTSQVPAAQLAMSALDADGFNAAVTAAKDALPCLADPLTPFDAAAYHGLMALDASFAGRGDDAARAFAAAIAAVPAFRPHPAIAPPGGTVDALMTQARTLPAGEPQALPPYDGVILIDGVRALVRTTGRPCVLQLVRPNGTVERTFYLLGNDPLPAWDPPPTAIQRFIPHLREKPSVEYGVAAGGAAVLAGAAYALGGVWNARFHDPATPYTELEGLQTQTNVAFGTSVGLGVVALAFGTVTVVRW